MAAVSVSLDRSTCGWGNLRAASGEAVAPNHARPMRNHDLTHQTVRPVNAPQAAAAVLEPIRFGEFLRDRHLISDEQWLAALATHWSSRQHLIGRTIAELRFMSLVEIEREARAFHDLDIVEVDEDDEDEEPGAPHADRPRA